MLHMLSRHDALLLLAKSISRLSDGVGGKERPRVDLIYSLYRLLKCGVVHTVCTNNIFATYVQYGDFFLIFQRPKKRIEPTMP